MSDDFENYVSYEQSKNKQIEKNDMEVGSIDKVKNSFKGFFASSNATKLSVIMFYTLLIFSEWKVFEASLILTKNNLELSLSVLLVTGISAAIAERAHQNPKATKNQQTIANIMWIVNLATAGIFGFMAFVLSGKDLNYDINLLPGLSFNINGANTILFGLVTILTFLEIIAYRAYADLDIDTASKRRVATLREKGRKADLDLAEAKMTQSTEIKIEHEKKLALIEEKLNTIEILNSRYAGKVPESVLQEVIAELTGIKKVEKTEKQPTQLNNNNNNQQQPNQTQQKRKYTKRETPESIQKEKNKVGELVGELENKPLIIPAESEDKKETNPFQNNQEEQDGDW